MHRAVSIYSTSVGKKIVMAVTGLVLFGFVFVHMLGNLKVYGGPEKFDAYAHWLRELGYPALGHGQALWIARAVLLAAVAAHGVSAWQLSLASRRARATRNARRQDMSFSYASRTMRWGGVVLAAFVVYHILHLTLGTAHPDFDHDSAYHNVVAGFEVWPVALAYCLAMVPLGLHVYHGLWSATQTLAIQNPWVQRVRRPAAAAVALAIVAGNMSIPLFVLSGGARLSQASTAGRARAAIEIPADALPGGATAPHHTTGTAR